MSDESPTRIVDEAGDHEAAIFSLVELTSDKGRGFEITGDSGQYRVKLKIHTPEAANDLRELFGIVAARLEQARSVTHYIHAPITPE